MMNSDANINDYDVSILPSNTMINIPHTLQLSDPSKLKNQTGTSSLNVTNGNKLTMDMLFK